MKKIEWERERESEMGGEGVWILETSTTRELRSLVIFESSSYMDLEDYLRKCSNNHVVSSNRPK